MQQVPNFEEFGVIIGPLKRIPPDKLANRLFCMLNCVGINCSDVATVSVHVQEAFATVQLCSRAVEDYAVKVFRERRAVMDLFDLRLLTEKPQRLKVERIGYLKQNVQKAGSEDKNQKKEPQIYKGESAARSPGQPMPRSPNNTQPSATGSKIVKQQTQPVDVDLKTDSVQDALSISQSSSTAPSPISFQKLEEDIEYYSEMYDPPTKLKPKTRSMQTSEESSSSCDVESSSKIKQEIFESTVDKKYAPPPTTVYTGSIKQEIAEPPVDKKYAPPPTAVYTSSIKQEITEPAVDSGKSYAPPPSTPSAGAASGSRRADTSKNTGASAQPDRIESRAAQTKTQQNKATTVAHKDGNSAATQLPTKQIQSGKSRQDGSKEQGASPQSTSAGRKNDTASGVDQPAAPQNNALQNKTTANTPQDGASANAPLPLRLAQPDKSAEEKSKEQSTAGSQSTSQTSRNDNPAQMEASSLVQSGTAQTETLQTKITAVVPKDGNATGASHKPGQDGRQEQGATGPLPSSQSASAGGKNDSESDAITSGAAQTKTLQNKTTAAAPKDRNQADAPLSRRPVQSDKTGQEERKDQGGTGPSLASQKDSTGRKNDLEPEVMNSGTTQTRTRQKETPAATPNEGASARVPAPQRSVQSDRSGRGRNGEQSGDGGDDDDVGDDDGDQGRENGGGADEDPRETTQMVSARTSTHDVGPCFCSGTNFYIRGSKLHVQDWKVYLDVGDVLHSDVRKFGRIMGQHVCAFLNTAGGSLFFGVHPGNQIIRGISITHKYEDSLRLDIDRHIHQMRPVVPPSAYRVNFAKVMSETGHLIPDLRVLEIEVTPPGSAPPLDIAICPQGTSEGETEGASGGADSYEYNRIRFVWRSGQVFSN